MVKTSFTIYQQIYNDTFMTELRSLQIDLRNVGKIFLIQRELKTNCVARNNDVMWNKKGGPIF